MSRYFDNWYSFSNDSENATTRFNLCESAKLVVYHRIDKQLRVLSDNIDFELKRAVDDVNRLSLQIATLNGQILSTEGVSIGTSNELRDQRDRALDELSELMDVFALEKPNGVVNVSGSERSLVISNFPAVLEVIVQNNNGNLVSDIFDANTGEQFKVRDGNIAALVEARNEVIPKFRELFDELAKNLIDSANNIHKIGVGLKGTNSAVPKNNLFFTGNSSINIELAQAIVDDVNNIAAARRVNTVLPSGEVLTTGSPGDNTIAIKIADLKQKLILSDGTESLIDFFNTIVSEIGIDAKEAHDNVLNQDILINQFTNLRESMQGVSLDEEFVSLIKFRRGFQGGAKLIQTVDEMFETLINI